MNFPSHVNRWYVLDRVRRRALFALWQSDMKTWDRCANILDRDAKRKLARYTARKEMADAV